MTPLQFEARYAPQWQALEAALDWLEGERRLRRGAGPDAAVLPAAELTALDRRSCEHLALARARAYPLHLTHRLEALAARAHRAIYRRHDYGLASLKRLLLVDFPQAVRAHRRYVAVAAALFVLPMLAMGWATWRDPGFLLTLVDAAHAVSFDQMYADGNGAVGRLRNADTDWSMFGFYVMHNVGIAFRCFAGGLLAGVGSVFFLAYNGLVTGGVAGYLSARGHGGLFWPFVVTHSAFELTAIVLSGAAGLRLGHALLAPGRRTRLQALQHAAREAAVLVPGFAAMLLVAAVVEAFWSSAGWIAAPVKYGVGAACWLLVAWTLVRQGRPARDAG